MKLSVRYLAAVLVTTLGYFLLSTEVQALTYDLVGLSAALLMLFGIHRYAPEPRTAWLLVALGILLLAFGDVVFGVWQPVPSPADMLYISGYSLLVLGMIGLVPERDGARRTPSLIVAGSTAVSVGLLAWMFLLAPTEAGGGIGLSTMAVSLGYPVLDLILLGLLAVAVKRSPSWSPAFRLLAAALCLLLLADTVYAVQDFGSAYALGGTADSFWLLAYGCFGAALLHPSVRGSVTETAVQAGAGWGTASVLRGIRFKAVVASTGRLVLGLAVLALFLGTSQRSIDTVLLSGAYGTVGSLLMLGASIRA